jgi:hypothetical protein
LISWVDISIFIYVKIYNLFADVKHCGLSLL